jgi:hypothetical protein
VITSLAQFDHYITLAPPSVVRHTECRLSQASGRLLPNGRGSVNPCKCSEDFRAARVSKRLARNDSRHDFGRATLGY